MQVIDKFTIENANHRHLHYWQCKSPTYLMQKMQVIDKYTVENETHR